VKVGLEMEVRKEQQTGQPLEPFWQPTQDPGIIGETIMESRFLLSSLACTATHHHP
jgi:hypothetical protein